MDEEEKWVEVNLCEGHFREIGGIEIMKLFGQQKERFCGIRYCVKHADICSYAKVK